MFSILITQWSCLILFLLNPFSFTLSGASATKADENEVTYVKVQERTYEKLILEIAFDTVFKNDQIEVYPKVTVFEDEVQFLDENSKILSRISLVVNKPKKIAEYFGKRAILSSQGNFVAIHEYTGEFGDASDYVIDEQYTIFNDRGEEIYRFGGPPEGTGEGDRLLISDKDGLVVRARIAYGALDFYNPSGEVKTVPIFGEVGWGKRRGHLTFSKDGKYLALLLREIKKASPRERIFEADIWVILFDVSGDELWRREVEERQLGNIAISDQGEYLIFNAYTFAGEIPPRQEEQPELKSVTLTLYPREGNGLSFKDTPLFSFSSLCFSPQADYVAVGDGNFVKLIRTKDGSTVFEKELSKGLRIRRLLFSSTGECLIVQVDTPSEIESPVERRRLVMEGQTQKVHPKRILIFDLKGNLIWEKDVSGSRSISTENDFVIISFPYKFEIYEKSKKVQ